MNIGDLFYVIILCFNALAVILILQYKKKISDTYILVVSYFNLAMQILIFLSPVLSSSEILFNYIYTYFENISSSLLPILYFISFAAYQFCVIKFLSVFDDDEDEFKVLIYTSSAAMMLIGFRWIIYGISANPISFVNSNIDVMLFDIFRLFIIPLYSIITTRILSKYMSKKVYHVVNTLTIFIFLIFIAFMIGFQFQYEEFFSNHPMKYLTTIFVVSVILSSLYLFNNFKFKINPNKSLYIVNLVYLTYLSATPVVLALNYMTVEYIIPFIKQGNIAEALVGSLIGIIMAGIVAIVVKIMNKQKENINNIEENTNDG